MVSTDGVSGVPVGYQSYTNAFGIAVIPCVPNYFRTSAEIDVNRLPDDVETSGSPIAELALTEGAIGFRRFDVLKGAKVVAILSQKMVVIRRLARRCITPKSASWEWSAMADWHG